MSDFQIYLTLGVFLGVILLIAFDWVDMVVAALLGVSALLIFGILEGTDLTPIINTASGPLALLFGGMVVAAMLEKTGIFEWVGERLLRATKGSGKRLLLLMFPLLLPLNALLPNATVVILVAPIIIRVCRDLKVDFVGPMILTAIISNAAGMLTLVSDPATFLVGHSIGLSFIEYLRMVSLGGLLAALAVMALLPFVLPGVWGARMTLAPKKQAGPAIARPVFLALALFVLVLMVLLFVVGDVLPNRIVPPAVAIIGASLALLLVYETRVAPVTEIIREVDWKTIVFLAAIFTLVQALSKTGLLQGMSILFAEWFGSNLAAVALVVLGGIGAIGGFIANIPLVAAALVMVTGYLVASGAAPELALAPNFTDWPTTTLPVFIAMMFGGTLGGNATMIGASANIVAVGVCAANGRRVTFMQFLRIGLPITVVQLLIGALYVLVLTQILG